jgi:hypothetical protein
MNKFQTLTAISLDNLETLLGREVDDYAQFWEPGTATHASLVEYIDRTVAVLPQISERTSPKQAAYVLRRVLRGLRRAQYLQTSEDAQSVFNGLHAEPERVMFLIIYPDGRVTTACTRKTISDIGAYCRAIETKTEAALVVPVEPTSKDNLSLTTSRSWR